jgi:DNA-binding beta-propeller fold protein YncE
MIRSSHRLAFAALVLVLGACRAPTLYWTDAERGTLERRSDDGEVLPPLVEGLRSPRAAAIDTLNARIYYGDPARRASDPHGHVEQAKLTGLDPRIIHRSGNTFAVAGIAVDPLRGVVYFSDHGLGGPGAIWRAAIEPPFEPAPCIGGLEDPRGIAVDLATHRIYWADAEQGRLYWADPDVLEPNEIAVEGVIERPRAVAFDHVAHRLYWTDTGADTISRCDPSDCRAQVLVSQLAEPLGLQLDLAAGEMYWTEYEAGSIRHTDLDGRGTPETIVSGPGAPAGLAILPR